jgi:hypothetical protein
MKTKILLFTALLFAFSLSDSSAQLKKSGKINFKLISLSETEDGQNNKLKIFAPGQKIWINLKISGLEKNQDNEFKIQADFLMTASGLKTVLNKGEIINQSIKAVKPEFHINFWIQTIPETPAGRYNVEITLKDINAEKYNKFVISFDLKK